MLILDNTPRVYLTDSTKKKHPRYLLTPIVTSSSFLGKGTFAAVFGPFDLRTVCGILQQLYLPKDPNRMVSPESISSSFSSHEYILRVYYQKERSKPLRCQVDQKKVALFESIPKEWRDRFLFAKICAPFHWTFLEIHDYGGTELFETLYRSKPKWTWDTQLRPAFESLWDAMQGCLWLIDHHQTLVTDIKPENMVIHQTSFQISLIDLEIMSIENGARFQSVVYTLYDSYVPVQFFNKRWFPVSSEKLSTRYIQKAKASYKETSRAAFETLFAQPVLSDSVLMNIARFCILWIFAHIIHAVLTEKGSRVIPSSTVQTYHTIFLKSLYTERYNVDVDQYCRRLHYFLFVTMIST